MIEDKPYPKPLSPSLEAFLAHRGRRSSIDNYAHEIINLLTVLNLVGARIMARVPAGSDATLGRDAEIFERSIIEAAALVHQLAIDPQAHKEFGRQDGQTTPPIAGQLLRFLRRMPKPNRLLKKAE